MIFWGLFSLWCTIEIVVCSIAIVQSHELPMWAFGFSVLLILSIHQYLKARKEKEVE